MLAPHPGESVSGLPIRRLGSHRQDTAPVGVTRVPAFYMRPHRRGRSEDLKIVPRLASRRGAGRIHERDILLTFLMTRADVTPRELFECGQRESRLFAWLLLVG